MGLRCQYVVKRNLFEMVCVQCGHTFTTDRPGELRIHECGVSSAVEDKEFDASLLDSQDRYTILTGVASMIGTGRARAVRPMDDIERVVDTCCMPCENRGRCGCSHLGGCENRELFFTTLAEGAACPARKFPSCITLPRVAILTPSFGNGGAERWMLDLMDGLSGQFQFEVVVVRHKWTRMDAEQEARQRCPVRIVDRENLARALNSGAFDAAIMWGVADCASSLEGWNGPLIVACEGGDKGFSREYIKGVKDRLKLCVGASSASERAMRILPAEKRTVIHHAVDPSRARPIHRRSLTRRRLGLKRDEIVVGFVGRVAFEKHLDVFVRAVSLLGRGYRGLIVGDGWAMPQISALNKELGEPCVMTPWVRNPRDAYTAIDLFVHPSPTEGFCLSIGEAALAGLPVISPRTGVLCDVSQDAYYRIGSKATPQQVASAIQAASADPGVLARAEKLKAEVSQFTLERMWSGWRMAISRAMTPEVSIVLPVRNPNREYFVQQLQSLKDQTFLDWELIVIDDASDDRAIVQNTIRSMRDRRMRVYRLNEHGGIVRASNYGASLAAGTLMCRCDHDDIWHLEKLRDQVEFMRANPAVDVVGAQIEMFGDHKLCGNATFPAKVTAADFLEASGRWNTPVANPTVMFRLDRFLAIGGYPSDHPYCEDVALWGRMIASGYNIRNLPRVLVKYRRHADQFTQFNIPDRIKSLQAIRDQFRTS